MSVGFYLCIGITPLCLYNTSWLLSLQDGIFHKILPFFSCIWEKTEFSGKKELTVTGILWYAVFVGVVLGRPFFPNVPSKTVENPLRF